jgi:hypothetical protein
VVETRTGSAHALIAVVRYAGFLTSTDDYHLMDSGLVVMETTLNNYNYSLWDLVVPTVRVRTRIFS